MNRECSCQKCIKACKHYPGWMSVEEARKAVESGHASRLMKDWYYEVNRSEEIFALCPATIGNEGKLADFWVNGRCTFLDSNDRCEIHNSGFKPRMCRESFLCTKEGLDKKDFLSDWNTDEGKVLIEQWEAMLR